MAGLGRRTFAPGEVLTATNVMGYLQDQAVMSFAGTAARGSAIGTAVAQGMTSFLQDSGMVETYYGAFGTANPGGRTSAGWFPDKSTGLVPIVPTSVVTNTGTATVNAMGVVTFPNVASVRLNGVFTSKFTNYRILIRSIRVLDSSSILYCKFASGGTNRSDSYSGGSKMFNIASSTITSLNGGDGIYLGNNYYAGLCFATLDVRADNVNVPYLNGLIQGSVVTDGTYGFASGNNGYTTVDGFTLLTSAGSMNGQIQVFGYNTV